MKEFFKRMITSWPTWTGALVQLANATYLMLAAVGVVSLPKETWEVIMTFAGVALAQLYVLFTIGNNPTDKLNY